MERKAIIAGNWKMNMTWAAAVALARQLLSSDQARHPGIEVLLCPPFTCIKAVEEQIGAKGHAEGGVAVGAQDVCPAMPEGATAFTGDISVEMLFDLGCSYCIVGHSERRSGHGETDEDVNAKARLLLEWGIVPIVCCGESEECREAGETEAFVSAQVRAALEGLSVEQAGTVVIAYEPLWAIGTGKVPTPEAADAICSAIRETVSGRFGEGAAAALRILYGGSLKPDNAEGFFSMPHIDGGLVGGASLRADSFLQIIEACHRAKSS